DFHAQDWCIQSVLDAEPDIYNHNMETVERLTPMVRSRAKYRTSLRVLQRAKEISPKVVTKSGVMLGLGETEPELFQAMDDLRSDFHAQDWCIQSVLDAEPDIYNHNMETVERLTPMVRSRAKYRTSLRVLQRAKEISPKVVTKSGVMLGLGETEPELFQAMDDL